MLRINSSPRISPLEEVEFLSKLVNETLPFDKGGVWITGSGNKHRNISQLQCQIEAS